MKSTYAWENGAVWCVNHGLETEEEDDDDDDDENANFYTRSGWGLLAGRRPLQKLGKL